MDNKLNNEKNEYLYIVIDKTVFFILEIIGLFIIFLTPVEAFLIVFKIIPNININNFIAIMFIQVPMLYPLFKQISSSFEHNYPIYHIEILINKIKIEIRICEQFFFKERWNEIKKVEVINEKSFSFQSKHVCKINFLIGAEIKYIRLFILKLSG